jgi:hypothetical protein
MKKADTCRLCELVPTGSVFVSPITLITVILGKVPLVRAGNTGTDPFSLRGHKRAYYPGGRCDRADDRGDGNWLWYVTEYLRLGVICRARVAWAARAPQVRNHHQCYSVRLRLE